ncbi:hypothetical protein DZC52_00370 [Wenzhouxiangella sediminis]|uniref:Thioredoxin n=1 Tax=Wenzhouxiangella sediminis TaxID=1792836 RepID=A0A3E1KCS9_9GAMM|nr:hypothetical protein DZC52_00370 [Wenzhouxiangella sediminis]
MSSIFRLQGWFLIPPSSSLSIPTLRELPSFAPIGQLAFIDKRSQWSEIPSWSTPAFHIYIDGNLVDVMVGWKSEESLREFLAKQRIMVTE